MSEAVQVILIICASATIIASVYFIWGKKDKAVAERLEALEGQHKD